MQASKETIKQSLQRTYENTKFIDVFNRLVRRLDCHGRKQYKAIKNVPDLYENAKDFLENKLLTLFINVELIEKFINSNKDISTSDAMDLIESLRETSTSEEKNDYNKFIITLYSDSIIDYKSDSIPDYNIKNKLDSCLDLEDKGNVDYYEFCINQSIKKQYILEMCKIMRNISSDELKQQDVKHNGVIPSRSLSLQSLNEHDICNMQIHAYLKI